MSQVVPMFHKHEDYNDDELIHDRCTQHLNIQRQKKLFKSRGCCLDLRKNLRKSVADMERLDAENKKWLLKVLEKMESPKFEIGVCFLVLVDMILVSFEALIGYLFTLPHHDGDHRRLAGDDSHGSSSDSHGSSTDSHGILNSYSPGMDSLGSCSVERAQDTANVCRTISLCILFLFAFELLIKFLAAPKGFFKHKGYILDFVVIFGSIAFEFSLHHSTGALLIFFRSWRVVRIMHAAYEEAEYFHKSMETEEHLEKSLEKLAQYKSYTELRDLRDDWKRFQKQGASGLEGTRIRITKEPGSEMHGALATSNPPAPPGVLPIAPEDESPPWRK